jgi:hypothetical protein
MKVAVCLSGFYRTGDICFPFLKNNILDPLNADVFISTWEQLGFWSQLTEEELKANRTYENESGFDTQSPNLNIHTFNKYNASVLMEKYRKFNQIFTDRSIKINENKKQFHYRSKNFISAHYKALTSLRICQKYEQENNFKYDLIIRTRPDIKFCGKIPLSIDLDTFYVCDNYAPNGQLGDIFFMGSMENMIKYHLMYHEIEDIISEGHLFDPHEFVKIQLERKGINYKVIHLDVELLNTPNGYCGKGI